MGGLFGEALLPGPPGHDLAQRQKALGGDTLVGHDAEQLAGRQAGIFHEDLEIVTRGKTLPRLPRTDGGNGNTQMLGDVFEGNSILPPPVAEGSSKAGADVAVKLRLWGHSRRLHGPQTTIKCANKKYKVFFTKLNIVFGALAGARRCAGE